MNAGHRSTGGESQSPNGAARKAVQFGPYELQLGTGELRKNGIRLKLQGKSFHILEALLERPGEVVTREELKSRLWPGDTFVDFESGLNTAANRLRLALGDSAENPRFIETVARSGYRFIGPVHIYLPLLPLDPEPPAAPFPLPVLVPAAPAPLPKPRRLGLAIGIGVAVVMVCAGSVWLATRPGTVPPTFRKITFRRGTVGNARFGPDGETILYSASWEGEGNRLFQANTVSPESRQLDYKDVSLAGVSSSAELALIEKDNSFGPSKLMRVPLNGGAPLTVAMGVTGADWAPDGKMLAISRTSLRESLIEFPLGKVAYRTSAGITDVRLSPNGESVAFVEHPMRNDDAGEVKLIERGAPARAIAPSWASVGGLAWAPSGKEVWFAASPSGVRRAVYAATPGGSLRKVANLPEMLTLFDISKTGKVLLGIDNSRLMVSGAFGEQQTERDLSWFDWTHVGDVSGDGNLMLLDETGDAGGPNHGVYLRSAQSDSPVHLGEGRALAISPDKKWALAFNGKFPTSLSVLPIGPEAPHMLSGQGIEYRTAKYFPDGQHLLVGGNYPGKPVRLFVQRVSGGKPEPLEPEIFLGNATVSPDGKQIVGLNQYRRVVVIPASGGKPRELVIPFPANPLEWSSDGQAIFMRDLRSVVPARIVRFDLATSHVQPWKELAPPDRVGLAYIMNVVVGADGNSYAYSYLRRLSELFVVDGWR